MQTNKTCQICGLLGHSKFYCKSKPYNPIKKSPVKTAKKPKRLTRAKAKENAWKAFSTYIRLRDSLLTTGTREFCICITCNERGDSSWKEYGHIQAGHAVGGRSNAILFDEKIVNGQCDYCNTKPPYGLGGDYGNYAIALIKRYGLEHVEQLQRLKGTEMIYKLHDFIEIEEKYKKKLLLLF